jgi:hypothetical protein
MKKLEYSFGRKNKKPCYDIVCFAKLNIMPSKKN